MEVTPFHTFIDFVRCEDQMRACLRSQEHIKKDLQLLEQQKMAQFQPFFDNQAQLQGLRKEIEAQELNLKDFQQKKAILEKKLERVTNPREYGSLEQELSQIAQLIKALEEKILELWVVSEQKTQEIKEFEPDFNALQANYAQQERALQEKLQIYGEQYVILQEVCIKKKMHVKPEWLEKYNGLKARVENPVVMVETGACTGCFSRISAQVETRLLHRELLPCSFCGRILYMVRP